ncbi:MAG: alpha/beta hydrolase [Chloroflexi bacterium]|nr:alpha/beta hydrolase [Chloroflexota bacterium]
MRSKDKSTHFGTSTNGARIAYDVTGSGPALILLHGAGKTRQDWHKAGYVEQLQNNFTVIAVDLCGTGDSDHSVDVADYAIEMICQDVNNVADACAVERFAVWGFSLGGNIARYLGAWSDRVTAIAMIGVPFGPAVDEAFDKFIDDFLKRWAPVIQAAQEGTVPLKKNGKIKGQIPSLVTCLRAMRDWPSIEPGEVGCPTLLLAGTRNKHVVDWIKANRDALDAANVKIEIVQDLTHDQEFTQIDRVFPVVRSFFVQENL